MKKYVLILGLVVAWNANAVSDCADGEQNCWDCGKTADDLCTARLEGTNLAITGTGEMEGYRWYESEGVYVTTAPWGNTPKGNTEITDITIDGITRVGNSAFLGATNLENITFSDSVVEIGRNALHSSGLTHLELPVNLKVLEGGAIENQQFIHEIVIPDGVETIGNGGFNKYRSLESIVIPDSVTELGGYVFVNCQNLKSVVIGENVKTINPQQLTGGFQYTPLLEHVYCSEKNRDICTSELLRSEKTSDEIEQLLKTYIKDKDGFYKTSDGKFLVNAALMAQGTACTDEQNCRDILAADHAGKPFKIGSKIYNSLDDFVKGNNIKFRIYTIDEANQVAGKTNTFSIRYR